MLASVAANGDFVAGDLLMIIAEAVAFLEELAGPAREAFAADHPFIVALDGQRVTAGNLQDLLQRQPAKTPVHFFRRGLLRCEQLSVRPGPADTCDLWLMPAEATDGASLAMRSHWLQSRRGRVT